jgi:hypothetical protein
MHSKVVAKILSISVALMVSVILSPGVASGELSGETQINVGEVVLNEPAVWELELGNINPNADITVQLTVFPDAGCGVEVSSDSLSILRDRSQILEVTYVASETGLCAVTILMYWFGYDEVQDENVSGFHTVVMEGNGREGNVVQMIMVDGRDTGVVDLNWGDQSISDWIAECAANAKNHGEFVSRVAELMDDMKKAGIITGKDRGIIQSFAAKAKIP